MEHSRIPAFARRWWWLAGVYMLAGLLGSLAVGYFSAPPYVASTTMVVATGASGWEASEYDSAMSGERLANTYSALLTKRPLLERVIADLGLTASPEALSRRIKVEVVQGTRVIVVRAEDARPEGAAELANALVRRFSYELGQRHAGQYGASLSRLEEEIARVQAQIELMEAQLGGSEYGLDPLDPISRASFEEALAQHRASLNSLVRTQQELALRDAHQSEPVVIEDAQAEAKPLGPTSAENALFAMLLGLMLSAGVAVCCERTENRVRSPRELAEAGGLPVIGVTADEGRDVPRGAVGKSQTPGQEWAESYRLMRTSLEFCLVDAAERTVVITSASIREGKSTVAANLGKSLAETGAQVVLVDANLRRPRLHKLFSLGNEAGLTTCVLHDGEPEKYVQHTEYGGLHVLTSGPLPPNSAELLDSRKVAQLVRTLSSMADYVIFDAPGTNEGRDATILARLCGGVVLVARAGLTSRGALRAGADQLEVVGARLLGGVLTGVKRESSEEYAYAHAEWRDDVSGSPTKRWRLFGMGRAANAE